MGRKDAILQGLAQGYFLVNIRDHHDQKTPLLVSSRWGENQLVKALLLRKADVLAQDMHGNSALAFASQYGHIDICKVSILSERERASRNGSTVVSIFITFLSFKPISLSLSRISSILKHPNKSFF